MTDVSVSSPLGRHSALSFQKRQILQIEALLFFQRNTSTPHSPPASPPPESPAKPDPSAFNRLQMSATHPGVIYRPEVEALLSVLPASIDLFGGFSKSRDALRGRVLPEPLHRQKAREEEPAGRRRRRTTHPYLTEKESNDRGDMKESLKSSQYV